MSRNFLIKIRDTQHTEERFITVYAEDEEHAGIMGHNAATLMEEDFHNGREFYVDDISSLE